MPILARKTSSANSLSTALASATASPCARSSPAAAAIAGHIVGFILDDLANEFDPTSVQFGEKYAPPFLPVSLHDWTGREITRVYSDEYGRYNMPVPSTYTANLPMPSGMSPNMLTACMNSMMRPEPSPSERAACT